MHLNSWFWANVVSLTSIGALFSSISYAALRTFAGLAPVSIVILHVVLIAALPKVYEVLRSFIYRFIQERFFRDRISPDKHLLILNKLLERTNTFHSLKKFLMHFFTMVPNIQSVAAFRLNNHSLNNWFFYKCESRTQLKLDAQSIIQHLHLNRYSNAIYLDGEAHKGSSFFRHIALPICGVYGITAILFLQIDKRYLPVKNTHLDFFSAVISEVSTVYALLESLESAQQHLKMVNDALFDLNTHLDQTIREQTESITSMSQALERAKIDAESAITIKSRFLATMTHDLRTPLHVIIGVANKLKHHPELPINARKSLVMIRESGTHLLKMVNDVLEHSKRDYLATNTIAKHELIFPSAITRCDIVMDDDTLKLSSAERQTLRRLRVLLCDDNGFNRTFIEFVLSPLVQLTLVESGEEALELASSVPYDIVLMDIQLGLGMNGTEAMRRIRSGPYGQRCAIYAVTGDKATSPHDYISAMGFDGYLAKPFTENDIVMLLLEHTSHEVGVLSGSTG